MRGADDTILVVGRADKGYRRLQIATDGRGVVSADGAEPAKVTIVDNGMIEVAIGNDRYRLTANTGRSEEHTSELQSLMRIPYAVLCLKKKTPRTERKTCRNQSSMQDSVIKN